MNAKPLTDDTVQAFYATCGGTKLVDADVYPHKIRRYLSHEALLISQILTGSNYRCALEIGCMYGRLMGVVLRAGLSYRGIDIVDGLVAMGRRRAKDMALRNDEAFLWARSVVDLQELVREHGSLFPREPHELLAIFPFNCFGNLAEPAQALRVVRSVGADILICTYTTDLNANEARAEYYAACGFDNVRVVQDSRGVRFTSNEGLCSNAYHPHYLNSMLSRCGYARADVCFLNPCGVTYLARVC